MAEIRKVCVVGTGHIGLPLSAVLAEAGFEVTGYDTNDEFITRVNTTGAAGFQEEGLDELLRRHLHRRLTLTSTPAAGPCTGASPPPRRRRPARTPTSSRWGRRSSRARTGPTRTGSAWPSSVWP